jgi:hypothetical protein
MVWHMSRVLQRCYAERCHAIAAAGSLSSFAVLQANMGRSWYLRTSFCTLVCGRIRRFLRIKRVVIACRLQVG